MRSRIWADRCGKSSILLFLISRYGRRWFIRFKWNYPYWTTLLLALAAGGLLIRIFILFHDCCHGSFFASRRANTVLGYVTGVLTFTAFEDWRLAHNRHHATAGDLDRRGAGDIWTMTTDEYRSASFWRRFGYRVYRNPFILLRSGSGAAVVDVSIVSSPETPGREREQASYEAGTVDRVGVAIWRMVWTYLLIQLSIMSLPGEVGSWLF